MRREWVQAGLAAIAPTFRFGPVLLDPKHISMPIATDINGNWVWDYRSDAASWSEDPTTNATDNALLAADPPTAIEGWLKLTPPPVPSGSGGGSASGGGSSAEAAPLAEAAPEEGRADGVRETVLGDLGLLGSAGGSAWPVPRRGQPAPPLWTVLPFTTEKHGAGPPYTWPGPHQPRTPRR